MGELQLRLLDKTLALLDNYARSVTREMIERDHETWLKVKAALELAAQCAIELALELATRRGLGVPQSYRDSFTLLAGASVVDPALSGELQRWAGLRNVLVHLYTSLDVERVHAALSETAPLRAFHAIAAGELLRAG